MMLLLVNGWKIIFMMIDIYDNFLDTEEFLLFKKNIFDNKFFPWFYFDSKVMPGDGIVQFTHTFYDNYRINSDYYKFLKPIIEKLKPSAIIRIKSNMTFKHNYIHNFIFHKDIDNNLENQKTGIFYINTNNGKTIFESGEQVDSVENRMIIFPGSLMHTGTTHTDTNIRCLINFNWY